MSSFLDIEVYLTNFTFNGGIGNIISYQVIILSSLSLMYSGLFIDLLLKIALRIFLNYQVSIVSLLRNLLLKV